MLNIDHVFFGHTIVKEPLTIGNMSWIDTGAFQGNAITVVEVDAFIQNLEQPVG